MSMTTSHGDDEDVKASKNDRKTMLTWNKSMYGPIENLYHIILTIIFFTKTSVTLNNVSHLVSIHG